MSINSCIEEPKTSGHDKINNSFYICDYILINVLEFLK